MTIGQQAAQTTVGTALARASSDSLIDAAFAQGRMLTFKAVDGRRIRIKKQGDARVAEIVADDEVVDAAPTGKFDFPNGESVVLENGQVVKWTDSFSTISRWAIFALLPGQ
jgi:hypothetical protein